jgi:hypothetical protein
MCQLILNVKTPGRQRRRALTRKEERTKLLHCVPQFFQIINAALFCAAVIGNKKFNSVSWD